MLIVGKYSRGGIRMQAHFNFATGVIKDFKVFFVDGFTMNYRIII